MQPLKIIFAGTPEFAADILQALLHSPHKIIAVYTQPDRPAGRGRQLTPSPVKQLALKNNLFVQQPESLRDASEQMKLAEWGADVMVVAAYGLLFPQAVLEIPRFGCVNVHPSLLPRWRGATPIQHTLLAGDTMTGVTIMQMEAGLDSGPMLAKVECPVQPDDTSDSLHRSLAKLGASALLEVLDAIANGTTKPELQTASLATYAHKITKENAKLDWDKPAAELALMIRAYNPWPVAHTSLANEAIRIWQARVEKSPIEKLPGTIQAIARDGIRVATGDDSLCLQKLQFPGGKIITAADVFNSQRQLLAVGQVLGQD